jgi:pyruvate, water dikinase
MSHDLLLSLNERIEAQVYGGKAARLSESLRAGLPVPPGCVLHPDAVARIAQGNLTSQEHTLLESALTPFTKRAVAVRSSALGEDGAAASFAGQYTSILNVQGMDTILVAIATVWASEQTEAARQYRARMGIAGRARVAVILQALVRAEVAGVLFTVDPLSGSSERWIVEASWGLGEAVVGGLVTPDRYIISRSGQLRERQLGDKDVVIAAAEDGGTTVVEIHDPERAQSACLGERTLVHLAELGAACERLFGPAQDIEWALSDGVLSLLQCRPVTSGGRI